MQNLERPLILTQQKGYRMKTKTLVIVVLILLTAGFLLGQGSANISGRVVDSLSRSPLPYANIVLYEQITNQQVEGTAADSLGTFTLNNIPAGEYILKSSFMGFQSDSISITIDQNTEDIDLADIALQRKSIRLEGAEVTAENVTIDYQINKKVLNVNRYQTSLSGSAVDILENAPSITTDIEGNVELRGSTSFKVLINGKPTAMEANQILQQIPASRIESVEIITNPSAKYDPEGEAGIVNLILRKRRAEGLNGLVNINVDNFGSYGGELLLNNRLDKFNFTLNMDFESEQEYGSDEEKNETTDFGVIDTTTHIYTDRSEEEDEFDYNIRGLIEYLPDTNTTFSLEIRGGHREEDELEEGYFQRWITTGQGARSDTVYNEVENKGGDSGEFYSGNLSFNKQFSQKNHRLESNLHFSRWTGTMSDIQKRFFRNQVLYGEKNVEGGPSNNLELKIDYSLPLNENSTFETGLQSRVRDGVEGNDRYIYDTTATDNWNYHKEDSREMEYMRNIHGLYAMFSDEIYDFGYQLGLRTEYTDRNIGIRDTTLEYTIERWDYFPTLHLSYQFTEERQIMASYTRRIERPRSWYLEAFPEWRDQYNIRMGNPDLTPEYIDSYEMGFKNSFDNNMISLEVYYRTIHDKIERIQSPYKPEIYDNVILHTIDNVGTEYNLGSELMFNLNFFEWWNINLSGNLYQFQLDVNYEDESYTRESFNWTARFNNTFQLWQNTKIQVNYRYNSPSVSTQGTREAFYATSASIRSNFLDNKLSAILQFRDIFDTAHWEFESSGEGFYTHRKYDRRAPSISLTLRYYINNYQQQRKERDSQDQEPGIDPGGFN